jgi:hypothetical protein
MNEKLMDGNFGFGVVVYVIWRRAIRKCMKPWDFLQTSHLDTTI